MSLRQFNTFLYNWIESTHWYNLIPNKNIVIHRKRCISLPTYRMLKSNGNWTCKIKCKKRWKKLTNLTFVCQLHLLALWIECVMWKFATSEHVSYYGMKAGYLALEISLTFFILEKGKYQFIDFLCTYILHTRIIDGFINIFYR